MSVGKIGRPRLLCTDADEELQEWWLLAQLAEDAKVTRTDVKEKV